MIRLCKDPQVRSQNGCVLSHLVTRSRVQSVVAVVQDVYGEGDGGGGGGRDGVGVVL